MKPVGRVLVAGAVAGLLTGAVATPPSDAAIDPPPIEERFAEMMTLLDGMQQSMEDMRAQMHRGSGMTSMPGHMDGTLRMMDRMRGMMRDHAAQMRRSCPALTPTPKQEN
jgi:hypothetical protein